MRKSAGPGFRLWLWPTLVWLSLQVPPVAVAQSADPVRFIHWAGSDVHAFAQSVVTPRAAIATGVAGGTVLLISLWDRRLTSNTQELFLNAPNRVRKVLHEMGNINIIRPMAVVVFLGALTSGDSYLQDAAFTSLEAVIYASLVTNMLKSVVGRARPNEGVGPASLKPFGGSRSFPSSHATTVFAVTTPWMMYYPGVASFAIFGLGIGTAVVRMADDYHWFTDVLAGAVIGAGTGYLLSRRHKRLSITPALSFGGSGAAIRVRL